MKVILEIDDKYASVLSITAVGVNGGTTDVSAWAVDITKHNHITLDENAHWTNGRIDNGELKPCPFCGGRAKLIEIQEVGCFRVLCEDCPTSVGRYWYYKKQDAIKAWNRRADNE